MAKNINLKVGDRGMAVVKADRRERVSFEVCDGLVKHIVRFTYDDGAKSSMGHVRFLEKFEVQEVSRA